MNKLSLLEVALSVPLLFVVLVGVMAGCLAILMFKLQNDKEVLNGLFLDESYYPEDVVICKYPQGVVWTIVRDFENFKVHVDACSYDLFSINYRIGEVDSMGDQARQYLEKYRSTSKPPFGLIVHWHGYDHPANGIYVVGKLS